MWLGTLTALASLVVVASAIICPENYVNCGPDEQYCYLGVDPVTQCDLGYSCEPYWGNRLCPLECPCLQNEIRCDVPMMEDDLSCPMSYCMQGTYVGGRPGGNTCMFQCPVECNWETEESCPLPRMNGCDQGSECVSLGSCTRDSRGCEKVPDPDTEFVCDGGYDMNGCPMPPVPMGREGCPASSYDSEGCPIYPACAEDESECGTTYDPITGCAEPPTCYKENDFNCPCDPLTELECWDDVFQLLLCQPRGPEDGCPKYCPVTCSEDTIWCPGALDSVTGCPGQETCVDVKSGCNVDSSGCPIHPTVEYNFNTHKLCPGAVQPNGCTGPDQLVDLDQSCPEECRVDSYLCPADSSGNEYCQFISYGFDGQECPRICNQVCASCGEQLCETGPDANGCATGGYCLDENDPFGCPPICSYDSSVCQMIDPETGDLHYDCAEAATNDLCQPRCPVLCRASEILCPGRYDEHGCQVDDYCIEAAEGAECAEVNEHYEFDGCPRIRWGQCDPVREQECHQGFDPATNCELQPVCKPLDGGECPDMCDEVCSCDQKSCGGGYNKYNCNIPVTCVMMFEKCPEETNPDYYNQHW